MTEDVATINSHNKVVLHDEEMSLTKATRTVLGLNYNVNPCPYWVYQGKNLSDLYNDTYGDLG